MMTTGRHFKQAIGHGCCNSNLGNILSYRDMRFRDPSERPDDKIDLPPCDEENASDVSHDPFSVPPFRR
jgi:hypothetical protein